MRAVIFGQNVRCALGCVLFFASWAFAGAASAAPYAAMVVNARSGEVLYSRNADTRLHPASLTKMMTLYLAFQAVEHGEIGLDTKVTISRNAAAEPPSKVGLRAGSRIAFRYLIRAASVKSANDAATAIGEALEGSEAAFARRMTRTARAMGMPHTTFKNAHGLTAAGHLSTARDMTRLGRHMLYDYPQYYNLFSRLSTDAGIRKVRNTNRRLLRSYRGADGIKTGFTNAAGFNLVASAKRGGKRVIATVFGGRSSAWRTRRVSELLDKGFDRLPTRTALRRPPRPAYQGGARTRVTAVASSTLPLPRGTGGETSRVPGSLLTAVADEVNAVADARQAALGSAAPRSLATREPLARPPQPGATPQTPQTPQTGTQAAAAAALAPGDGNAAEEPSDGPRIVTRISTSGGRHWGIDVGRFGTRYKARQELLKTALSELGTLEDSRRKIVRHETGFDATFIGMTREEAALACRHLAARDTDCETVGPPS